ncbi:MAG: hypothetical protein C5B49_04830 [Bdellovibrio sp.]|nr:MAG: hypothetical protein C5B49_04830 [Bdellovibrio sp.]
MNKISWTHKISWILFWALGLGGWVAQATLVDRTVEVTTKEKNPAQARHELNDQAQAKAIEDLLIEILGEERFHKNQAVIQNKIIKLAPRLLPFAKPGNLEPLPDGGFKMTFAFKVNQDDVDQLILNNGLAFETDVQPVLLPLVYWIDKTEEQSWAWWLPGSSASVGGAGTSAGQVGAFATSADATRAFLAKANSTLENLLRNGFLKTGFFSLRPQWLNVHDALASPVSLEPSPAEMQAVAAQRGVQVVVAGEMQILPSPSRPGAYLLDLKMGVVHMPRARKLAQVARRVETEVGAKSTVVMTKLREILDTMVTDLAGQTLESWQRGAVQSNSYRVTLVGPVPILVQEGFREALKAKSRDVRAVRERLIGNDAVVFEIETATRLKDLAQRVAEIQVNNAKLVLKGVTETELKYVIAKGK